jgi:glycerol-3-phosphate dehydrogenase
LFGVTAALRLAADGFRTVLIEGAPDILTGASFVNQNRVHAGFHYPRSLETAHESLDGSATFEPRFSKCLRQLENYYAIARDGSSTSATEYARFLATLRETRGVAYEEASTQSWFFQPETMAAAYRVYEPIADMALVREQLKAEIAAEPRLTLMTRTRAMSLEQARPFVVVTDEARYRSPLLINATYGNLNWHDHPASPTVEVQMVEMVELESERSLPGITVMDGPFCGILPFGMSKTRYWYYSVNHSVHARVATRHDVAFRYPQTSNWDRMLEQGRELFTFMSDLRMVRSHYALRTIMVGSEIDKTAARPSTLYELEEGFLQVLSGKLTTCIVTASRIAERALAWK